LFVFGQNGRASSPSVDTDRSDPQIAEQRVNVADHEHQASIEMNQHPMDSLNDINAIAQREESPPPNLRQNTEDELRAVMAASILSAQQEEEKRMQQVTTESADSAEQHHGTLDAGGAPPSVIRSGSVSMTGFWAKGKGLSSAALATMFSQSDHECIVCYEDYEIGQVLARLKCGHILHKKCAKEWLGENPTCPVCRMNVMRPSVG